MAISDTTQKLSQLLDDIQAMLEQIDRIEGRVAERKSRRYPPASEADISAAEKKLAFQFPPSYRAFLKLNNGWHRFHYGWSVFGVSGPGYAVPEKDWRSNLAIFERTFKRQGKSRVEELQRQEKMNPNLIYMPHHPILATDFNGGFRAFDRNRPISGGEYEIAEVSSGQFVEGRLLGFMDLVRHAYASARSALTELGGELGAAASDFPKATVSRVKAAAAPRAKRPSRALTANDRTARKSGKKAVKRKSGPRRVKV
jgi:cell wall assembly regulator SMI1